MRSRRAGVPGRIFIVEDNEIMRGMLVEFISTLTDHEVVGAAASGEEALEALPTLEVDLLLVDMSLPGISGAEFIGRARRVRSDVLALVLSAHGERSYVERARAAGSRGYLLKGNPDELPEALNRVLDGEEYVSKAIVRRRAKNDL